MCSQGRYCCCRVYAFINLGSTEPFQALIWAAAWTCDLMDGCYALSAVYCAPA